MPLEIKLVITHKCVNLRWRVKYNRSAYITRSAPREDAEIVPIYSLGIKFSVVIIAVNDEFPAMEYAGRKTSVYKYETR